MLIVLATVNAFFVAWATALETRHPAALARARRHPKASHHRADGGVPRSRPGRLIRSAKQKVFLASYLLGEPDLLGALFRRGRAAQRRCLRYL